MFYKRVPRGMLPKLVKFEEPQRSENVDGEFAVGDKVIIQDPLTKRWKQKGRIIKLKGDKSYIILTDDNKEIWRNQKFLRKNKIGMPIKVGAKESVSDELTNTRRSERIKKKTFIISLLMDTGLLKVIGDLKKEIKRLEREDNEMSKSEVNQHGVIDVAATVPVTISGHLIYGIAALVVLILVLIYFWRRDKFG